MISKFEKCVYNFIYWILAFSLLIMNLGTIAETGRVVAKSNEFSTLLQTWEAIARNFNH